MPIIIAKKLTKKFKDLVAVDNVDLEVEEGECFGLLGPNGAGKTSLIRMLTAVSPPNSGEAWVSGLDLKTHAREAKAMIGVVPQGDNLDPDLTVLQNLLTFARYFDIPRDEAQRRSMQVLDLFELQGKKNGKIQELSGGMKRRLLIARGLINEPRILILDEPTIGLDPQAKYLVWHKLSELKSRGVTLLLCTQNMEEAAALCDRVAIMHRGRFLSIDKPQELVLKYIGKELWEIDLDSSDKNRVFEELRKRGLEFESFGNTVQVFHVDREELLKGLENLRPRWRPATLEDVFLRLTGRSLIE